MNSSGNDYLDMDLTVVYPGDSFLCTKLDFSEDIVLKLGFENYEKSKEIKIF